MKRQSSKESMARLFQRYVWLVDLIYRHNNNITFKEINEKWQNSPLNDRREEFPNKTFHNHKAAISSMFDIDIECNSHGGYTYYIEHWDGQNNKSIAAVLDTIWQFHNEWIKMLQTAWNKISLL